MGYYTGTANDLEALRQAIFTACTGEGWTLAGDVLHKNGLYARLQVVSGTLRLLGGTGIDGSNGLTGAASAVVQIGGLSIAYPLTYELFLFASEVYVVVNYSVDRYQWCSWGTSGVSGVGGSGMWFGATNAASINSGLGISLGGNTVYSCGALFWYSNTGTYTSTVYVNHGLDGGGWASGTSLIGGAYASGDLLKLLPNAWNSEAVLIPARLYLSRASSKYSLIADADNFRHTRIDNYTPGEVVTIGSDRWKILPWHRKDAANRNGGSNIQHSGTFGWAIRYEGP